MVDSLKKPSTPAPSLVRAPYASTIKNRDELDELAPRVPFRSLRDPAHVGVELVEEPIPFALATPAPVGVELIVVAGVCEAVDWDAIAPHPRLPELEERCRCGAPRGEHLVGGDERAEKWPCNGWQPSTVKAPRLVDPSTCPKRLAGWRSPVVSGPGFASATPCPDCGTIHVGMADASYAGGGK